MALRSTTEHWGSITRLLHWLIAVAVLGMIAAGLYAGSLDVGTVKGDERYFQVIDLHKSFGLIIITLTTLRVLWRLGEPLRLFGVKLPTLIHVRGADATLAHHFHVIAAFTLMGVIGLHLLGALKNHFVSGNDVLRKMLGSGSMRT